MPAERPSSQQVEMEVKHGLPSFAIAIQHQAKATVGDPLLPRDSVCNQEEVPEEPIITVVCVQERRKTSAGNYQDGVYGLVSAIIGFLLSVSLPQFPSHILRRDPVISEQDERVEPEIRQLIDDLRRSPVL